MALEAKTRNLAVLLTDIKGFTDKTSRSSRADILALLEKHKELVLPVLEARGGRLVKTIGDAFLMVYESPTDAVLAGVAVQEALREHNAGLEPDERIEIRIAINSGEVTLAENDVFGEAVNITARIEGVADAGEVFFTEAVYLAMNKSEVPSSEVGLLQLKGIPEKVRVYKVRRERPVPVSAPPAPPRLWGLLKALPAREGSSEKASYALAPARLWRRALALAIDGLLCSILLSMFFGRRPAYLRPEPGTEPERVSIGEKGIALRSGRGSVLIGEDGIHLTAPPENASGSWRVKTRKARRNGRFALLWFLYNWIFLIKLGATPGKRILKLAVLRADGSPLGKRQALGRSAASLASAYALFLGYLWALFEPRRRGWHDLLAGTVVVSTRL